jgi:hypothetical protein
MENEKYRQLHKIEPDAIAAPEAAIQDDPTFNRIWYVHEGQEFVYHIPSDLPDEDFDLMFFLVDEAGTAIYSDDLASELAEIYGPSTVRLSARINRLRRWIGDDFDAPRILEEFRIKGKRAYKLNVADAKMLQVDETKPSHFDQQNQSESTVPDQEYALSTPNELPQQEIKREYDRIKYSFYRARYGIKEITTKIPDELGEVELQLLHLLTKGIRPGSLTSAEILNKELDDRFPTRKKVPISTLLANINAAFRHDQNFNRLLVRQGHSYKFNVDTVEFLSPEPKADEVDADKRKTVQQSSNSVNSTHVLFTEITQYKSDPLQKIRNEVPMIDEILLRYINDIATDIKPDESWNILRVVNHFRGFSGTFTRPFIEKAVQSKILGKEVLQLNATLNREEIIRLRFFHEHQPDMVRITPNQLRRFVKEVLKNVEDEEQKKQENK